MEPVLLWLVAYFIPCAAVLVFLHTLPGYHPGRLIGGATGGAGLILSVAISQLAIRSGGLSFPWTASSVSVWIFIFAAALTIRALGKFGAVYAGGVLLQEACMLSVAFYLLHFSFPLYAIIFLVVPFFSLSHLLHMDHWHIKIAATFLWGATSILLFAWTYDFFLISALHALFGTLFIRIGIVYPETVFKVRRVGG